MMTIDRLVLANAALLVIATLAFAHYLSPLWLWGTLAIAVWMLQAALTGWCPQAWLLKRLGVRRGPSFG